MLRSGDAFIDQSFIIASPFVVLIRTGCRWHFVPGRAGHRSQRSDSGAIQGLASFGSVSDSPVNSRLACSQSDFDTSCAERPLMTASSTARSRTILRVTVPRPAEFSVRHLPSVICFHGQKLPHIRKNVCELCVVFIWRVPRSSCVSRDLKKCCPAFETLDLGGFLGIRTRFVDYGLENRSLRRFREFGQGCFHKFRLPLVNWGLGVFWRKAKKCYRDLRLKLARSSASSQSNVVFVSGFSPSLEQFS